MGSSQVQRTCLQHRQHRLVHWGLQCSIGKSHLVPKWEETSVKPASLPLSGSSTPVAGAVHVPGVGNRVPFCAHRQ